MASIIVGWVLSFFFIVGLGIVYAGDLALGVALILIWLILCMVAIFSVGVISTLVGIIARLVWMYSLYTTFILMAKS